MYVQKYPYEKDELENAKTMRWHWILLRWMRCVHPINPCVECTILKLCVGLSVVGLGLSHIYVNSLYIRVGAIPSNVSGISAHRIVLCVTDRDERSGRILMVRDPC